MKLDAFKLTQKGGLDEINLYVTVFKAQDLIDRHEIDRWTKDNPGGYQRMPQERRLREARGSLIRYLQREMGSFPTSILINVRGDVEFKADKDLGWFSYGTLDTGEEKFWVIDGQHRIEALKRTIERNRDFQEYPVIASIMTAGERLDEMMLFYIVNKRQKSVSTDLVYRHLQRMLWEKGRKWMEAFEGKRGVRIGYATDIVDYFNDNPDSPFYQRIHIVGQPRTEAEVIQDSNMTRSIANLLKLELFRGIPVNEVGEYLLNYWKAVHSLYPECFHDPSAYSLLDTARVNVLNRVFPLVFSQCLQAGHGDLETMTGYISKWKEPSYEHSMNDFKKPIEAGFWLRSKAPLVALSTSREEQDSLYNGLVEKLGVL